MNPMSSVRRSCGPSLRAVLPLALSLVTLLVQGEG